jgi:hypothetical protein
MNYFINTSEHLVYMNLWGEIVAGDDVKFRNMITPQLHGGNVLYEVNIFTVGGDVGAAIGIGRQLSRSHASQSVTLFEREQFARDRFVFLLMPAGLLNLGIAGGGIEEHKVVSYKR